MKLTKYGKRITKGLVVSTLILSVFLTGCSAINDIINPNSKSSTSVTFNVSDAQGLGGDCYYRIIELVSDLSDGFAIKAVYQKNVSYNGSYTFDDVAPGSYGAIIGGYGDSYADFSIATGEHVTVTCKRYYAGSISNYYGTFPLYKWSTSISKN